ncbi:hypothetical protein QTI24_28850 [Variovorax sp. J22P240]|uniref:hypothetical protein n=1 Tax=Variovorax sp. J22P240 TaxID=3053514 RepID=UPI002575FB64|nr:hypothetical protein [Variovorax sp. J22P240]MDM0002641.1 hypothetical protein [Variovorax sp. J22P240]
MSTQPDSRPVPGAIEPEPNAQALSPWRDVARELFDEDGLSTVFTHARNLITCTVIIAAGMFAAHHPLQGQTPATWTVHFAGYVVTAVGVLLLLLNLCDGLRSLARRQHPMVLRLTMVLAYLGLSVRLVQVFMLFRLPL